MTTTTASPIALPETAPAAARAVFRLLRQLRVGTLDVQLPDGSHGRTSAAAASRAPRCACTTGACARRR